MHVIAHATQIWLKVINPRLKGYIAKILYQSDNIKFGKNFKCDTIPRILIDKNSSLIIKDNVTLRSGVEIRSHMNARITIEDNVQIDRGVRILGTNDSIITIGSGTKIGLYSVLNGGDAISIGNQCLISGFVYLQTSMHRFSEEGKRIIDQGYHHDSVKLESGSWLGTHAVILPGVTIGEGAIVGSNAVVTKNVDKQSIVVGVPAAPIQKSN